MCPFSAMTAVLASLVENVVTDLDWEKAATHGNRTINIARVILVTI